MSSDSMSDLWDTSSEEGSGDVNPQVLQTLGRKLQNTAKKSNLKANAEKPDSSSSSTSSPEIERESESEESSEEDEPENETESSSSSSSSTSSEESDDEISKSTSSESAAASLRLPVNDESSSRQSPAVSPAPQKNLRRASISPKKSPLKSPAPSSPSKRGAAHKRPSAGERQAMSPARNGTSPRKIPAGRQENVRPRPPPRPPIPIDESSAESDSTSDLSKIIARKAAKKAAAEEIADRPGASPTPISKTHSDTPPISPRRSLTEPNIASPSSRSSSQAPSSKASKSDSASSRRRQSAPAVLSPKSPSSIRYPNQSPKAGDGSNIPGKRVSFEGVEEEDEDLDSDSYETDVSEESEFETDTEEKSSSFETDTTFGKEATQPVQSVPTETYPGVSAEGKQTPEPEASTKKEKETGKDTTKVNGVEERSKNETVSNGDPGPKKSPARTQRRKPFTDVPKNVAVTPRDLRPIKGDRENETREGRTGLGFWGLSNTTNEEEIVFSNATEQNKKGSGLFGLGRLFGFGKTGRRGKTALDEDGESYGGKVWDTHAYNDSVSQITDPNVSRQKKRKASVKSSKNSHTSEDRNKRDGPSTFTQPGSRMGSRSPSKALEDLEPLSSATSPIGMEQFLPRHEKRNTKTALAGLEPLSILRYDGLQPEGEKRKRAALAQMETTSVDVHMPSSLDTISYDELETGSVRSRKSTETMLLRRLSSQQAQMVSLLQRMAPDARNSSENKPREQLNGQERSGLPDIIEEEEVSFQGSVRSSKDKQKAAEKGVLDDLSRLTEDPIWSQRSFFYCLFLLLFLGGTAVGIWALVEFVLFEDSPSPLSTMAPSIAPPPTQVTSIPTTLPNPSPITPPIPSPTTPPRPSAPVPSSGPTLPVRERLVAILSPHLSDGGQSFVDPTSPQSKAVDWLGGNEYVSLYDEMKIKTRFTLAMFYYSTDGDNWIENSRWLSDSDECAWYAADFVAPCTNRQYTQLVLGDNNVQGTLPADLIVLSDHLTRIDIGGTISGTIPYQLAELTNLKQLRVHGKEITGEIPAVFSQLTSMVELDLAENRLTGSIPTLMLRYMKQLEVLDLHQNSLHGLLSGEIANLVKLTDLSLYENNFRGDIPFEIGTLSNLESLNLDGNTFSSLPRNIGLLTNLKLLSVRNNNLGGTLQTSLGALRSLKSLYLNANELSGTIPTYLGRLTDIDTGLDLSDNKLTGPLPSELGQLTSLKHLILRNNQLSGTVPSHLSNIQALHTLRLDINDMTGTMPTQLCEKFDLVDSTYYVDCEELDCPCCNFCCTDTDDECYCPYEATEPILCVP